MSQIFGCTPRPSGAERMRYDSPINHPHPPLAPTHWDSTTSLHIPSLHQPSQQVRWTQQPVQHFPGDQRQTELTEPRNSSAGPPNARGMEHGCVASPPPVPPSHQNTPTHHQARLGESPVNSAGPLEAERVRQNTVGQFTDFVKTIYRKHKVDRNTKYPPRLSTEYVNLALIDRSGSATKGDIKEITESMVKDGNVDAIVEKKKRSIKFEEVANLSGGGTLVLLEGAPGVGKSTFAWEYCRRWERGEIAQQYDLVLLLRLTDDRISKAQNLGDLLYHPDEKVRKDVVQELIRSLGARVLIILEGFDELPDHCRKDDSFFLQLISGQLLPEATVMVTSRPWATKVIHKKYGQTILSQHIEILGFTSKQVTKCIQSILSESEAADLEQYLSKHPQIKMCMYIPLNTAIVVGVYRDSQEGKCILPTTSTELYIALTQTLLYRYLHGHPNYGKEEVKPVMSFENDLPPEVYKYFQYLCNLAYSGIATEDSQVQLIFSGLKLPSDFDSLGFMDSVTELYVTQGAVVSYNYLHLSLQEFLATQHISNMSPEKQLEHLQRSYDGRYRKFACTSAGKSFSKDTIGLISSLP